MRALPVMVSLILLPRAAAAMFECQAADRSVRYSSSRIAGDRCTRVGTGSASLARFVDRSALPSALPSATPPATRPALRKTVSRIYVTEEDGIRQYSNTRPVGGTRGAAVIEVVELTFLETCYLCGPAGDPAMAAPILDTVSYGQDIERAASAFGVEAALVRAVIHAESGYKPHAISRAGAQGLMQLMPSTAHRFRVSDPFDAAQNIRGGVAYLAWLLKRFHGNVDLALASFNAGEATIDRYSGMPPYAETRTYVTRVKTLAERYRARARPAPPR